MINLVIDPRDPALVPLGPSTDGKSIRPVDVTVATSRTVRLAAGGFVLDGAKVRKQIPAGGSLTVSVPATDGTEIHADDRSTFVYVVTLTVTTTGRTRDTVTRTFRGLLPTSLGATVQVTQLVNAEPLPAPYTSIQDVIDGVADVNDSATATLVNDSTSATSVALRGVTVPALAGRKRSAAVADGTTNQAALINADLAALGTAGGGTYELPSGVIYMAATLAVPANVTVTGATTAGIASTTGTVLKFAAGVKGCTTANFSGLRDLTLTSLDNGVVGSAIGVDIGGANGAFQNVLVSKFGSHGWHSDTTAGGNENKQRMDNCRAYGNGGDGLHIDGLDSNAWLVTFFDATANKGTGIWNEGCRSTFDQCHIDSAAIGIAAVRDNNIGNTYNVYVEASGATGADFILGSSSTFGIVEAPYYGMPNVKGEGGTTLPFQSWRIYEKSGFRQLLINDNLLGPNSGAQWIFDSGISALNVLRLRRASGGLVFDVDGTGMTRIAFGINLAAGTDGAIDVGTSTRRFRNGYFTSWVRVGTTTTAARPTAATAGAGASMFDTTLNKPIWSTGSAWVDATGATV